MPPAVRVGILAPGSVASSYVAVVVVVVVIPRLASTVPITTREQDERRSPSSPRDRIASALLSLSVGLLAASAPMVVAAAAADDSGASIAANSKITTGGASTLQSGRVSVCGRFVFFLGGGSNIIPPSLPHAPTHPRTQTDHLCVLLSFVLSLTLSLRSRLLDDRDNPRRQPRQLRL